MLKLAMPMSKLNKEVVLQVGGLLVEMSRLRLEFESAHSRSLKRLERSAPGKPLFFVERDSAIEPSS
ncbi:unnamed protein product [Sphagnum compactum]